MCGAETASSFFSFIEEISRGKVSGQCSVHPLAAGRSYRPSKSNTRHWHTRIGPSSDRVSVVGKRMAQVVPDVPLSTLDSHCGARGCGKNDVVPVFMPLLTARRAGQAQRCSHGPAGSPPTSRRATARGFARTSPIMGSGARQTSGPGVSRGIILRE